MTPFQPEYDYPSKKIDLPGKTSTALIQYSGDSNFDIQVIFFGDRQRQTGSDQCVVIKGVEIESSHPFNLLQIISPIAFAT